MCHRPILFALLLAPSLALAAEAEAPAPLTSVEATKALCDKAVSQLVGEKPSQAMAVVKPYWTLPAQELDELAYKTDSQLAMVAGRFGKPVGYEFVDTRTVGRSFVRHTYLGKFERHAVRMSCTFYKPADRWVVNGIVWDDQISRMFDEPGA